MKVLENGRKPLAVRILAAALTVAFLTAAVFLIFGEIGEEAALCKWVGWGLAQTLCWAGGIVLVTATWLLDRWCFGLDTEG